MPQTLILYTFLLFLIIRMELNIEKREKFIEKRGKEERKDRKR
jgi:hypothetical protein